MAFNFPDPSITTEVINPVTGSTYKWIDPPGKWVVVGANVDFPDKVWEGDTPPNPPDDYEFWFNSDSLSLFYYYKDPDGTGAWVPTSVPLSSNPEFVDLENRVDYVEPLVTAQQNSIGLLNQITVAQNHRLDTLDNKVESLEGNTLFGNWKVTTTGSAGSGKVLLYKTGLQGGVVSWTDVAVLGFSLTDEGGVQHTFDNANLGDRIRMTFGDGSVSQVVFIIDTIPSTALYEVTLSSSKGTPQDGDSYYIEFLSAFDPSDYATISYVDSQDDLKADIGYVDAQDDLKADLTYVDNALNSLGGDVHSDGSVANLPYVKKAGSTMTGTLISHMAGSNANAWQLKDTGNGNAALNILCQGGAGTQIKYRGQYGTEHWFQNYDSANANPRTTFKIGRDQYELSASSSVQYSATDGHYFTGQISISDYLTCDKTVYFKSGTIHIRGYNGAGNQLYAIGAVSPTSSYLKPSTGNSFTFLKDGDSYFKLEAPLHLADTVRSSTSEDVTVAASDAWYIKGRMLMYNGSVLNADYGPTSLDHYLLTRFKEGIVVKKSGESIAGSNVFSVHPTYGSYDGDMTEDNHLVNKGYIDDKFTGPGANYHRLKSVMWDTDFNSNSFEGCFCLDGFVANPATVINVSSKNMDGGFLHFYENQPSDNLSLYVQGGYYIPAYHHNDTANVSADGFKVVFARMVTEIKRNRQGSDPGSPLTPSWTLRFAPSIPGETFAIAGQNGFEGIYYFKFGGTH